MGDKTNETMFPYVKKKIEVEIRGKMKALPGLLPNNRSVSCKAHCGSSRNVTMGEKSGPLDLSFSVDCGLKFKCRGFHNKLNFFHCYFFVTAPWLAVMPSTDIAFVQ